MPRATFTDPKIAQVGLTEIQARDEANPSRVIVEKTDRAVDQAKRGFIKR